MKNHRRNIALAAFVVLGFAACSLDQPEITRTQSGPPTSTASPTMAEVFESPTPTVIPTLIPQVLAEMEELEDQVASLRGLTPLRPIERQLISVEDLAERVQRDLLNDFSQSEAADDARLLTLLGLLPANFDLWLFYQDLYTEQIAGFYDADEEVLYIVAGTNFDGPERLTYVHEYAHALQDQHFDLDQGLGFNDEMCEIDVERCAAIQALIEGDASLLEEQWLRTFASQEDFDELMNFYGQFESPTFDQAPSALKENFVFPYRNGLEFVRWYFQQDGWAAVDDLYSDPPTSTEMILHPLRYPNDDPVQLQIREPDETSLGQGWRLLDQGTLGEFDFKLLLSQWLPQEAAETAAAGWAGDEYVAFFKDGSKTGAWYIIHQWDTIRDAQDTYLTWRDYGEARYGPRIPDGTAYTYESDAGFARLELASNQTLWLAAPDAETLNALRQTIEFPADN